MNLSPSSPLSLPSVCPVSLSAFCFLLSNNLTLPTPFCVFPLCAVSTLSLFSQRYFCTLSAPSVLCLFVSIYLINTSLPVAHLSDDPQNTVSLKSHTKDNYVVIVRLTSPGFELTPTSVQVECSSN